MHAMGVFGDATLGKLKLLAPQTTTRFGFTHTFQTSEEYGPL